MRRPSATSIVLGVITLGLALTAAGRVAGDDTDAPTEHPPIVVTPASGSSTPQLPDRDADRDDDDDDDDDDGFSKINPRPRSIDDDDDDDDDDRDRD